MGRRMFMAWRLSLGEVGLGMMLIFCGARPQVQRRVKGLYFEPARPTSQATQGSADELERGIDAELFAVFGYLQVDGIGFGLKVAEFFGYGGEVDGCFFLEGVDVAGDVEIVVVFGDFFEGGQVAVFILLYALAVGIDDDLDVVVGEFVLVLFLFKVAASVNEQYVVGMLAAPLEDENTGGDTGAVEDVGREANDGIEEVAVFDEEAADEGFGTAAEEYAVGGYYCHLSVVVQVVDHVLDEGEIGFALGG